MAVTLTTLAALCLAATTVGGGYGRSIFGPGYGGPSGPGCSYGPGQGYNRGYEGQGYGCGPGQEYNK